MTEGIFQLFTKKERKFAKLCLAIELKIRLLNSNLQTTFIYRPFKMDNITFDHRPLFNLEDEYNNSSSATNITFNVSEEAMMDGMDPILAEVFESPTLRILACIAYILLIPIGCTLLFLILHYEQFGGDPQKRSIFNQVIGFLAAIELVTGLVTEHIFMARVFIRCLPSGLGTFFWFTNGFKDATYTLLFVIATTYKMIRTYSFRRIAGLNDDFLSLFFLMASVMNSFIFTYAQYMLGHSETHPQYIIMTCSKGHEVQLIATNT